MTASDSNSRIFLTLCALSLPLMLWISIGSNAHLGAFLDVSSLVLLPLLIVGLNFVRAQFAKDEQSWIERMPTSTALATMVCVVIGFVGVVINLTTQLKSVRNCARILVVVLWRSVRLDGVHAKPPFAKQPSAS